MSVTVKWVVCCLFGLLPLWLGAGEPAKRGPVLPKVQGLHRGQTRDEVLKLLGPPRRIARQILYQRHLEQWLYDRPHHVRLEFECPRGKVAQLTAVQPFQP